MDCHRDCDVHSKKRSKILSNFADLVAPKASHSPPLKHDNVVPPHIGANEKLTTARCNPLSAGFADKRISWVCSTWKNVCSALPKQGFLCVEEVTQPGLHLHQSSPDVKCCHQNNLEIMAPLERHILLFMLKRPLLKGHVFPHADDNSLHCNCVHGSANSASVLSVGIFLQKHAKDSVNLAHTLMDGKWARTRLHSLGFARLQGEPGMICANAYHPETDFDEAPESHLHKESPESPLALLQRISLRVFAERILHAVPQQQLEFPDKEMLDSVQDFFLYTEAEGRQVFEELDRDADGKLTMDDLKVAMKKMKLPADYAKDFMKRKHRLWPSRSYAWSEFSSLIQEKEPVIIQLFNSLGVSESGTVNRTHIKESLKKAGVSATEGNVTAMMKFLAIDRGDYIKYGEFRRFMLLLPTEQLMTNPWNVWLKAATAVGVERSSQGNLQESVFKHINPLPRIFQIGANQQRFESEPLPC